MGSYRSYRAPADDGAALVDPDWPTQLKWIEDRSASVRSDSSFSLGGAPLAEVARSARGELIRLAYEHTSRFAEVDEPRAGAPLVASGHQPDLFHPGVWLKNFALDALAKASGGVGVHLLIDSDLCRGPAVRAPTGSPTNPRVETIPFDARGDAVPYEERTIHDPQVFASFPDCLRSAVTPLIAEPLVGRLWPAVSGALERTDRLGEALSAGRRAIEGDWGVSTLELPFSRVCDTASFRVFAFELLRRAGEFRAAYNASLREYRVAHKLRNAAQPLPDLAERDGGVETGFWCWSERDPARRPLTARPASRGVEIGDGRAWSETLSPIADEAIAQLAELREAGVKLRSRALVTTLYCRWVLADLFLHGIGGAKYDQVTDRLSERFFGAPPPPHATLTATLRLPIERTEERAVDESQPAQRLRDLRYHPETYVGDDPAASPWIDQKAAAIATPKTAENAAARHRLIVEANEAMRRLLAGERRDVEARLRAAVERRRRDAVLDSREYSFCLFPEDDLLQRLLRLAGVDG